MDGCVNLNADLAAGWGVREIVHGDGPTTAIGVVVAGPEDGGIHSVTLPEMIA